MKLTGPDAVPPEESSSFEARIRDRFTPEPEPPWKISPSSLYQSRIESIESSTERMKQALTCCLELVPDVEPDRRVEAEHLVQQHPGQLVVEDLGVLLGGEVAVLLAGAAVLADDPVDDLAQAGLALRGADGAAEVLGRHDVGRVDAPEVGELHPALLEVHRAVAPVRHHDVAALPGHLVVGVHALSGPHPLDPQAGGSPCRDPEPSWTARARVPRARGCSHCPRHARLPLPRYAVCTRDLVSDRT